MSKIRTRGWGDFHHDDFEMGQSGFNYEAYDNWLDFQGITPDQETEMVEFLNKGKWAAGYGDVRAAIERWSSGEPTPVPEFGELGAGKALFYEGETNALFGPHSAAKSWTMLYTAKQSLERGDEVLYLDFEDSCDKAVYRLLQLGIDRALLNGFHHVHPPSGVGEEERKWLGYLVAINQIGLCVIDTVGVALGMENKNANWDSDIASWLTSYPNLLASYGTCVVLVDHLAKTALDETNPGGSGRKLQSVSGAAYSVKAVQEFGKGRIGKALLTCRKDRNGNYSIGEKVATFVLDATNTDERFLSASLSYPAPAELAKAPALYVEVAGWLDEVDFPLNGAGYAKAKEYLADSGHELPGINTVKQAIEYRRSK